jgi:hypothetical protein
MITPSMKDGCRSIRIPSFSCPQTVGVSTEASDGRYTIIIMIVDHEASVRSIIRGYRWVLSSSTRLDFEHSQTLASDVGVDLRGAAWSCVDPRGSSFTNRTLSSGAPDSRCYTRTKWVWIFFCRSVSCG